VPYSWRRVASSGASTLPSASLERSCSIDCARLQELLAASGGIRCMTHLASCSVVVAMPWMEWNGEFYL
jgi:hypothetical protein